MIDYYAKIYTSLSILLYKGGTNIMTNIQRMKNDMETADRRESTDKATKDNRARNDEMTLERRDKADKTLSDNRLRNDEMTADRRELKDGNFGLTLVISLLIITALAVGTYYFFLI